MALFSLKRAYYSRIAHLVNVSSMDFTNVRSKPASLRFSGTSHPVGPSYFQPGSRWNVPSRFLEGTRSLRGRPLGGAYWLPARRPRAFGLKTKSPSTSTPKTRLTSTRVFNGTGRRASSRALDEPFHYLQRFFTKSLAGSQPFANSLFKKTAARPEFPISPSVRDPVCCFGNLA